MNGVRTPAGNVRVSVPRSTASKRKGHAAAGGKRLVKRESAWSRLQSMPVDVLLAVGVWWADMDLEKLFARSSLAIALVCNAAYLVVKMYRDGVMDDADDVRLKLSQGSQEWLQEMQTEDTLLAVVLSLIWGDRHPPSSMLVLSAVEWALIAICIVNSVHVFTRTKSFVLFRQPTEPRYPGDQQWIVRSRNARIMPVDVARDLSDTNGQPSQSSAGSWVPGQNGSKENKWVVQVWNPSEGSLVLFAWFSPPQIAVLYGTSASNWLYNLPVACLTALMMYTIVSFFNDRLNDQQILSGQLLHEFTESFVYHQSPFRPTRQAAVGDDMDTVDGTYPDNLDSLHPTMAETEFVQTRRRSSQKSRFAFDDGQMDHSATDAEYDEDDTRQ
ncbi:hypothetical protein BC831DRAFT_454207 [Entophlyctis helioformis]|nr:hypothetical protein BC831DRAFT_454207 [Entophlyctis helioformis]